MTIKLTRTQIQLISQMIDVYEEWIDSQLINIEQDDYTEKQAMLSDAYYDMLDFYIKYTEDEIYDMTDNEFSAFYIVSAIYIKYLNCEIEASSGTQRRNLENKLTDCISLQTLIRSYFPEYDFILDE